ncbi:AAA-domain-containing protein [Phlegmacium glaucopus]|nr:AAA-domain-containing protein [Phlegmacium glaucopus]
MSILFDKRPCVQTTWAIKKTPPNFDDTTAVLNRFLWDALTENLNPSIPHLCISVTPIQSVPNSQHSFVCWAALNEENGSKALEIPLSWSSTYQHTFSGTDILLKAVTPTALTVVIVTALSSEAYSQACANHSALGEWLSLERRILRQGDVLSVPKKDPTSVDVAFRYRLDMLEPVLQGHVENGTTKIIVALSQTDSLIHDSILDTEGEQDAIEIDEGFLGSSILSLDLHTCSTQNSPLDLYKNEAMDRSYPEFSYKTMHSRFKPVEDHYTLFFRTSDLGKIGILNGDWAIVGIAPSKYRLVRVLAKDSLIDSAGCLTGSPLLLHNILSDGEEFGPQVPSSIYVRPSPFGSAHPPIPVARSVTIARVASPNSINRRYQPFFLHSLKKYFDAGKRLVKQNDIIAVSIDTDPPRWLELEEGTGDDDSHHADLNDFNHPSNAPRTNELVFFKVTSIEYDVVSKAGPPLQDLYTGSTLGELGCWIDTSITRMTQAGVEHTRVPDAMSYLQIDATSSTILRTLESLPTPYLLGPKSTFSKLLALTSAALSQRAVEYNLHLSFLLKGGRGIGKFTVVAWVSQRLGLNLQEINCYNILGESDVRTEAILRVKFEQASACTPCLLVLRHLEALTQTTQTLEGKKDSPIVTALRECINDIQTSWKTTGYPLIVIGTTSASSSLPVGLASCFKQEILFQAPNEGERLEIFKCLLSNILLASDVSLQRLATQTAALLAGDLCDLVARAKAVSIDRAMNTATLKEDLSALSSISITASDFDIALGKARDSYSESIGAPKIPNVTWDDVGGLAHVKSDILDTIQLPLDRPDLFAEGLKKRSGVLLYGPPGTGKTLIAKAVATSCSMNFFSVKGPELLNMYIGESEANVRRVFQRARDAKPCVIFFDELDSVAPQRGNHGDSGGVMDRIVSQLLAELDGMSGGKESADVFVIGATNRPDLLDPALLRPGRFDRMLYLGVSDSHEAQLNILEALTRKFRLDPGLDLHSIAQKCPFNLTGADFYALCSDAMLNAMSRKAEGIDAKISVLNIQPEHHSHPHPVTAEYYLAELASAEDIAVHVSQEDFDRALDSLVPSVSQAEMEHYAHIQKRFSQGAVDEIGSSDS